jgi:hypothetical protein
LGNLSNDRTDAGHRDQGWRDGDLHYQPEPGGPFPGVFLLIDAPGIREELGDMMRRLATVGYYVLLPNLYYRAGRDTIFGPDVLDQGSPERERMRAVRTKMTIPRVMEDVGSMLAYVDRQSEAKPGPAGADHPDKISLLDVVKNAKPTVLIGVSGQPELFPRRRRGRWRPTIIGR